MKFEGRELPRHAEYVDTSDLKLHHVYFKVNYYDDEGLIPELLPVVFIGRNLGIGDNGMLYFQDLRSFRAGARFGDQGADRADAEPVFERVFESQSSAVCEYEGALNLLLKCSLRRAGMK